MTGIICPVCKGIGLLSEGKYIEVGEYPHWLCEKIESIKTEKCSNCDGKGFIEKDEALSESTAKNIVRQEWLLSKVRDFNGDIHRAAWESRQLPLEVLNHYTKLIADKLYGEQTHWHQYKGPCMKETPFEINMQALALLVSIWVTDIYLRKARDRNAPGMEVRYDDWLGFLQSTIHFTRQEIKGTRDLDAEKHWEKDRGKTSRIKHFVNKLFWRH